MIIWRLKLTISGIWPIITHWWVHHIMSENAYIWVNSVDLKNNGINMINIPKKLHIYINSCMFDTPS